MLTVFRVDFFPVQRRAVCSSDPSHSCPLDSQVSHGPLDIAYFLVVQITNILRSGCLISSLFYSTLGCVLSLQEVALCQCLPSFSVLCYPRPYRSLLPHNVISPTTFWSSDCSYTLYRPLCATNSPYIIFHSGDVSSPFPFRIGYVLDCVCHSGSFLTHSVFLRMINKFSLPPA